MENVINKIYRKKDLDKLDKQLKMLGSNKMTSSKFYSIRLFTTIIIFVIFLMANNGYILAPLISISYYYLFYYYFITYKLNKRTKQIDNDALEYFEILTLTLKAGRNLEDAIRVTSENVDSKLSKEFQKALDEMDLGKSLEEALESLKERIPSETVNNIILNIIETSEFGSSILGTMNHQIDFLREKEVLEVREEINKLPNKISIISVIFIVPLIIILILGPYLIKIIS